MARSTDIDGEVTHGGAGLEGIAASTRYRGADVLWVNFLFHVRTLSCAL